MSEQQPSCAKCEALIIEAYEERAHHLTEAQDEYERRVTEANEPLQERLVKIYLEHERGEHAEDTG